MTTTETTLRPIVRRRVLSQTSICGHLRFIPGGHRGVLGVNIVTFQTTQWKKTAASHFTRLLAFPHYSTYTSFQNSVRKKIQLL